MSQLHGQTYIANMGDASPLDYGGLFVYVDADGRASMELLEVDEQLLSAVEREADEREAYVEDARERALPIPQLSPLVERAPYTVYRVDVDPCTYVNGVLSDNPYHADSPAWFAGTDDRMRERPQDTTYLSRVADFIGADVDELIAEFCSADILTRASAWRAVYDYHGWANGDSYPIHLTRAEARERYAYELTCRR